MSNVVFPTAQDLKTCVEIEPTTAETTAGIIEYVDVGEGPALLCVHGAPGGYDQGLLFGELFRQNGFRLISMSRPGFLGTPLSTGKNRRTAGNCLGSPT